MTPKETIDALLRLLEIAISWPVILLIAMIVMRKELRSLIVKLADRMTKAPGGFEFAVLQERVEKISAKVEKLEKAAFEPSAALTPALQSQLQSSFDAFQDYLVSVGYKTAERNVTIFVDPALQNAHYDGKRIVLGKQLADDTDALFREYTHHALLAGGNRNTMTNEQAAVESGLADYFPCSFSNDPAFGEASIHVFRNYPGYENKTEIRMLDNDRKFTEVDKNAELHDVGEIWSGAFWEIRAQLGQASADKLLFSTWMAMLPLDTHKNFSARFAKKLIDTARSLEDGDHSAEVAETFQRRKLKL